MWFSYFIFITFLFIQNAYSQSTTPERITFTVVYDNYVITEGTTADWGFSCLIQGMEKTILFDTGTKTDILKHNFEILEINPSIIELLVLSHDHRDHTGGVSSILASNPGIPVYILPAFSFATKTDLEKQQAIVTPISNFTMICKNVYLTGIMGDQIKEQSLIVDSPRGLIVVTGCSHQGIVNIIKKSVEELDKPIYLVFGGFHLLRHSDEEIKNIISDFHALGVQKCGPTHCTGENAIAMFEADYAENFVSIGTGKTIIIE